MQSNGRLRVQPVPVRHLAPRVADAMWRLYADHYDHVDRETFDRDLAEKAIVFVATDAGSGAIVGFSTALLYRQRSNGRDVGIYFSGDTIIHPCYWGQRALHRAVLGVLLRWKLRHPLTPLYWYLICSGYRTYLTLVRNFPEHWPRYERPTPEREARLIDAIGRARYPAGWKPDRGVVSLGEWQPVLKASVAPFTNDVLALPEVCFFVQANPGYATGDELAMIARVGAGAALGMLAKWAGRFLRGPRIVAVPRTTSGVPQLIRP